MHYYKRNLGDYAKKAGRLSMLQHGSYTLLIDACYDREQFPTLEEAIEWTWASSKEEIEAVEFVLKRFFVLEDCRYVQKRIQEEVAAFHEKGLTNSRIAKERESKRAEINTKRAQSVQDSSPDNHESPPNQEPRTKNQEPLTNNLISLSDDKDKRVRAAPVIKPLEVTENVWIDFVQHRKSKKAAITQTAINGIKSEADKAGIGLEAALVMCLNRGWTGFKADWVTQNNGAVSSSPLSFKEKDELKARETYESITGKVHPKNISKRGVIIESIGGENELAIAVG